MPVTALPPDPSGCCPSGCSSITPISPVVTVTDNGECKAEPMGVVCFQNQSADLTWVFKDSAGEPVDLTGCSVSSIKFRMQEIISRIPNDIDVTCTVNNLVQGGIRLTLPAGATSLPGVFEAQFGLSVDAGDGPLLRHINRAYIIIENSMFGVTDTAGPLGPPPVSELMMGVQMGDPARSDLLRRKEWNIAEIAQAIARPVEYFNVVPPYTGEDFTTTDFPLRWDWREATIAELMKMAAAGYLRDHMVWQGGSPGSAFDDKAKWEAYMKIAEAKWANYQGVVLAQKASFNMRHGYAFAGTPYSVLFSY